MKKIVGIIGTAAVLASSIFAVDFAARVYMNADVAAGDKDHVEFFNLKNSDQKDDDALVLSANTDKAGAKFQVWYNYTGSGAEELKVRGANLWFKPLDMLKITVGDIDVGIYGEKLHYWKDPVGAHYTDGWGYQYSNADVATGAGFACELTPIDGLWIGLAGAAGTDSSTIALTWADGVPDDNKFWYGAWGVGAKYDLNGLAGIPLSVGVSWRDSGKDDWKLLGIGADYGVLYGDGLYAMLNGRLRFNEGDNGKLAGITIDNFVKFATGAFKAEVRAPVTIRLEDNDPSWLVWSARVSYALDGFTPYLLLANDLDNTNAAWLLSDAFGDTFNMQIKPGVTFNVGTCSIDAAVRLDIPAKGGNFKFAVPVELGVKF